MSWKPEDIDKKKYQVAKKKCIGTNEPFTNTNNTNTKVPRFASTDKNYKKNDDRPSSTMMKFDDIFEVPVNLEVVRKINQSSPGNPNFDLRSNHSHVFGRGQDPNPNPNPNPNSNANPNRTPLKINPSRNPPSRQLMDSWKTYFDKKKGLL
jgi:hypothetical protein